MSEDKELFEILEDQFSLKRLYPKDRLFTGSSKPSDRSYEKSVVEAPSVEIEKPIELAADNCEFAVGECFGSENRTCIDKTFCPEKAFKNPDVFLTCHTRLEKLKERT